MGVTQIQSVGFCTRPANEEEKHRWVEEHARRLQQLFGQWQNQVSIDGEEYRKYLTEDLLGYCDNPLLKSLIESIT